MQFLDFCTHEFFSLTSAQDIYIQASQDEVLFTRHTLGGDDTAAILPPWPKKTHNTFQCTMTILYQIFVDKTLYLM